MWALDVGCNNGFFSAKLAARGVFTIGLDPDEDLVRLAQVYALETKTDKLAYSLMQVDPDNVCLLPRVDVVLLLSVMHYWVETYGLETAKRMLSVLWDKTRVCMYFEIPNPCENNKMASMLSFMGSTEAECKHFLENMLVGLGSSAVIFLGYLPTDFRGNERRHIFLVRRSGY
jgi:SAM-dependent methyltransferase